LREAKYLHAMRFETFLVDFHGSGESSESSTTIGYREAEDVSAAVHYVRKNFAMKKPLILFGKSMGAAAIFRAVAIDPELQPDLIIAEAIFERLYTAVANRFHLVSAPPFPAAHLMMFWGGLSMNVPAFRHNPIDYARHIECPTLLLHGTDDPRALPREAEAVQKNITAPSQLILFEGVTHQSCAKAVPEKWKRAVREFVDKHDLSQVNRDQSNSLSFH
ncbi:MAG: alpha/beta fold hydrolase, partial [Verrucomicrobiota bacterium]